MKLFYIKTGNDEKNYLSYHSGYVMLPSEKMVFTEKQANRIKYLSKKFHLNYKKELIKNHNNIKSTYSDNIFDIILNDIILCMKEQCKKLNNNIIKEDKVRKRQSYIMWINLYNFCRNQNVNFKQTEKILKYFHNILNDNYMYRTHKKSDWSQQSLELFLNDLKNKK